MMLKEEPMTYDKNGNATGYVVWMTGLSGSGKTTIALILEEKLKERDLKVERLDGDVVRESLTRDLGFTAEDRRKNIERVTFVAKLLSRNGVGTICSFISPYQSVRDHVRENTTNFLEVYIDAPLDVVMERDVKGLYKKALAGEIPNFTGISDPFEAPENPDIHIRTDLNSPEECVGQVLQELERLGYIPVAEKA
jgi:adenylyl-sulfate kinase